MESISQSTEEPMTPQEWQWFLESKGLIAYGVQLERGRAIENNVSSLPPTATILCECESIDESNGTDSSMRVAQGLLWLHKAYFHDLNTVHTALSEAKTQKELLDKREKLLRADIALVDKEWAALRCDLGLPDDITVNTKDLSKVVKEWQETKQMLQFEEEMKRTASQHAKFLSEILSNYQQVCKRTQQSPSRMNTLQQVISSDIEVEYTAKASNLLRNELKELSAFFQARLCDCAKHSIPTFMTLVASDDIDMLKSNIKGLNQALEEIKSAQQHIASTNEVKVLETTQARVLSARQRLQENSKQLKDVETKIQSIENDIQWCCGLIESVRTTLEKEISLLLNDNTDVEIKILNVV